MLPNTSTAKVMINYDPDKNTFMVSTPFALNYLVQSFPERKWDAKHKVWRVPANWRCLDAMESLRGKGYTWTTLAKETHAAIHLPLLDDGLHDIYPEDHPFRHQPFEHQREGYRKGYSRSYLALFFEQGLGKTKTSIDLACMWHVDGDVDTVVVICPLSISSVWDKEMIEHCTSDYTLHHLRDIKPSAFSNVEKILWNEDKDRMRVLVVGIESLSIGGAWDRLVELSKSFGNICLIVDESSRAKNHKATRTKRVIEFADTCVKRLILSGTPVTQGIQDLYSQFQILNPDTIALTSYYAFRNRYCVMGGFDDKKIIAYKNIPELMSLIEPFALRKEKAECLDLPEKTFQVRNVEMAPTQAKAYKELKKNLYTEIETASGSKDTIEVEMVLEAYLRLQQISGGFYPVEKLEKNVDGHVIKTTTTAQAIPGKNPKLNELVEIMDDLRGKVIIFARFRAEVAAIAAALDKDYKVVQFHGGLNPGEKAESVHQLQDGDADVLVASEAAAYGLTLTAASTMIYYSLSFSLEVFLQSQDRIHRIGQTMVCSYIILGCTGTVDSNVNAALMEKKTLADFVNEQLKNGEIPF